MEMQSFCQMINCPMLRIQPININPMINRPACMNYTYYNTPIGYRDMYGVNPSLFQMEMKPVSIKEIED